MVTAADKLDSDSPSVQMSGELRTEYPFKSKFLDVDYASIDGQKRSVRTHYLDEGSGFPIVFLHGNPTWSFYFRNIIKSLSDDFRCLALDHYGCGFSERNDDLPHRLEDRAVFLSAFLDQLKIDSFHLVVHDWGGAIGMYFATRNPKRIKKVVITNTAAFTTDRISWRINLCRTPILGSLINKTFNGFLGASLVMATTKSLSNVVKRGFLLPYKNASRRTAIDRFVKDIPMTSRHPSFAALKETEGRLQNIDPEQVMILWGGRDFCFSRYFYDRWREFYPRAEYHYFEDAGHYLFEDKTEDSISLIREFVSENKG